MIDWSLPQVQMGYLTYCTEKNFRKSQSEAESASLLVKKQAILERWLSD